MARARTTASRARRLPDRTTPDQTPDLTLTRAGVVDAPVPCRGSSRDRARAARLPAPRPPPVLSADDGRGIAQARRAECHHVVDLVVLAEVRWGYFRTRKQFLLSRFPERWRIFYAQPPAFGTDDPWRPRTEGRVTYFTVPFLKTATTSAPYNTLASTTAGRALIEWGAERWLSSRLRSLGVEREPAVLVSNIYCPGALARLRKRATFYDYNDSPFQFAGVPAWAEGYWKRTARQVDAFFVV